MDGLWCVDSEKSNGFVRPADAQFDRVSIDHFFHDRSARLRGFGAAEQKERTERQDEFGHRVEVCASEVMIQIHRVN
jgi:hypothetical protein